MTMANVPEGDEVVLSVPGADELGERVKPRFVSAVTSYAVAVLDETSRIEFLQRGNSASQPEYTSAQVDNAVRVVNNRGVAPRKRSGWVTFGRILLPLVTVFLGVAIAEALRSTAWVIPAGLALGVSVATAILLAIFDKADPL